MRNTLFIIDPQNDFMGHADGTPLTQHLTKELRETAALPVAGAVHDMDRLITFIDSDARGAGIHDITVTLDTHEPHYDDRHIGHPHYWVNGKGDRPAPFTFISYDNFISGKWWPYDRALADRVARYLKITGGQVVWPRHCIAGTWGHEVYGPLDAAIERWSKRSGRNPGYIRKGMNNHTEQYGIFEAAVPDPSDPKTHFATPILDELRAADRVWVAGEAKSHCVKASGEQAVSRLRPDEIAKFALLTDCMSNVTTFESQGDSFVAEMIAKGMKTERAVVRI